MSIKPDISGMCVFVVDSGPPVHRRPIWPGQFISADTWQDTDISGEDQIIKAACAATWTPSALAAYKAANPWVEPASPRPLENISKNIIWERMTEQEAAQADAMLKLQPPKILRIYEGATYVSTKADLYPQLLGAMTQMFGPSRAAEILEPNF